jgi:hypothetical protein
MRQAQLKGWTAIAKFLGSSPASAQTWAKQRTPVKREGRFAVADPTEVQIHTDLCSPAFGLAASRLLACRIPVKITGLPRP